MEKLERQKEGAAVSVHPPRARLETETADQDKGTCADG